MSELQNVQRGILFTFFMYSVIIFLFFIFKMIKNRIDKDAGLSDQDGGKYADNMKGQEGKSKTQEGGIEGGKELESSANKQKQSKISSGLSNEQATMNDLVIKMTKQQCEIDQNESIIVKLSLKLRHHVFYHLPFFFPVALNIVTGTSYSFLFVLFFFLQVTFGLFNDLKIHRRCVENKIVRIIVEHIGYVLTFFAWVNLWGAGTASMPFVIVQNI